jgi:sugar phosphate permease
MARKTQEPANGLMTLGFTLVLATIVLLFVNSMIGNSVALIVVIGICLVGGTLLVGVASKRRAKAKQAAAHSG